MSEGGECWHVSALRELGLEAREGRNLRDVRCYLCESREGGLRLCLRGDCLRFLCSEGAENHSLAHYRREPSHCLRLDLADSRLWCYRCEREVTAEADAEGAGGGGGGGGGDAPEAGLTGLQNVGNTCYMNAALQALSNTPPLLGHFLERPPPPPHGSPPLTRAFHRLLLDMWSPRRPPYLAPTSVLYGIRTSHPMFRGFHQHDTQEFLRCLMDQLHEEMKTPDWGPPLSAPPRHSPKTPLGSRGGGGGGGESGGEGGAASSQSEGEEYETCDSGVSERSSLSEEPTPDSRSKHLPFSRRSASRTPSPRTRHGSPPRRKHPAYRSIISDVFDGKLISSVQCLTCNRVSTRVETFQDLSLPIPGRDHLAVLHQGSLEPSEKCSRLQRPPDSFKAGDFPRGYAAPRPRTPPTAVFLLYYGWWAWLWDWLCSWFWGPTVGLHDCLAAFFSADELKGDNMYSCEKCDKLRNGVKYSRVLQCPEVLCVHLKRFRHELMFSSKINNYVTFPLEGLDLRPYLHSSCPSEVTSYDLTSVICHHGIAGGGGHYTCYALNAGSQRWYEFDDQSVRRVSPDTVRTCEAYVLFYRKDCRTVNRWRKRAARLEEMCGEEEEEEEREKEKEKEKQRFLVSREWIERFNCWGEPGPVDNRGLLCGHGRLRPGRRPLALPAPVWAFLHDKFGGGPVCRAEELSTCEECGESPGLLRLQWLDFQRLQNSSDGRLYAVPLGWLAAWEAYVKGSSHRPPGPVDNTVLSPHSNEEFCEVTSGQWELVTKLYGGGPEIPIKDSSESDSRSLDERTDVHEGGAALRESGRRPPPEFPDAPPHSLPTPRLYPFEGGCNVFRLRSVVHASPFDRAEPRKPAITASATVGCRRSTEAFPGRPVSPEPRPRSSPPSVLPPRAVLGYLRSRSLSEPPIIRSSEVPLSERL